MDFDLFALEDDEEFLQSIQYETQHKDLPAEVLPEFQCLGTDSWQMKFSEQGFLCNSFLNKNSTNQLIDAELVKQLTPYELKTADLCDPTVVNALLSQACLNLQQLISAVEQQFKLESCANQVHYENRHKITLTLHIARLITEPLSPLWQTHIARFRNLLNVITSVDMLKRIYNAQSIKGNDCSVASYHLMHGILEWKLLDLCLLKHYKNSKVLKTQLEVLFNNLITCALCIFKRTELPELLQKTPFTCTCFKELWLLLQLALTHWQTLPFWTFYNQSIIVAKDNCLKAFGLNELQFCQFNNWLMNGLLRLQGYRSNGEYVGPKNTRTQSEQADNYEALEQNTTAFLKLTPKEEDLWVFVGILKNSLINWCQPKIGIPNILWEFYYKTMNTVSPSLTKLAVTCNSGCAYLKRYKEYLEDKDLPENMHSFTEFTLIVSKIMRRLFEEQQQNNAQKLLGRIFSKFSSQKFLTLNELGIHHLTELFLGLALSGDYRNLLPKLRDKLLMISLDKINAHRQAAATKAHMALVILHAEQKINFAEYLSKLFTQVANVQNPEEIHQSIGYSLRVVFQQVGEHSCGEHLLIELWLPTYLSNCAQVFRESLHESLHTIIIETTDLKPDLNKNLIAYILPYVKTKYICSNSSYIPQLAADFCAHKTLFLNDEQSLQKHVEYFVETQTTNRAFGAEFVLKMFDYQKEGLLTEMQIMRIWLRCLVLLGSQHDKFHLLSKDVQHLLLFRNLTQLDAIDLGSSKETLSIFVKALAKNYEIQAGNYKTRVELADNINNLLKNFENWLPIESCAEAQPELYLRFFTFLAVIIFNCTPIVYIKSKNTCFFHIALTRFILPTNVQMGKVPDLKYTQIVHKVWPVIMLGMARLNYKTDSYIEKSVNDLIQKWVPNFKTLGANAKLVARPFIACLQHENQEFASLIFEKLAQFFLTTERRQANVNACLVLTILQECLEAISQYENLGEEVKLMHVTTLFKGSCCLIFEHIMLTDELVPSRSAALELLRLLVQSNIYSYSEQLRSLLAENLSLVMHKHLSVNTFFYFNLLQRLLLIDKKLLLDIWSSMVAAIKAVEKQHGGNKDQRLRDCLHKLQRALHNKSN